MILPEVSRGSSLNALPARWLNPEIHLDYTRFKFPVLANKFPAVQVAALGSKWRAAPSFSTANL